jgi:hypothetical protein
MLRGLSTLVLIMTLAACSPPRSPPDQPESPEPPAAAPATDAPIAAVPEPPPAAPTSDPSATIGGDGSAITLSALAGAEITAAKLEGELACSFSTPAASPLIVARGNAASKDAAFGMVKVGDYVERIAAPGGYDAMVKGAVFSGAGKTITITLTAPATAGGEAPPTPATLTYDRADGAKRVFPGVWTCGP